MNSDDRIFVAGHRGLVGSAICRRLESLGYGNIMTVGRDKLDLRDGPKVTSFFKGCRPQYVFLAAAVVGGIGANSAHPAKFIRDNLLIQQNVIDAAQTYGTTKLCFLGSSCIYPKYAEQPIREESLMTGPLEPTNAAYAVAKIAGITLCQAYSAEYGFNAISLMPANLYGPGDNFDPAAGHVIPALMRRFVEARESGQETVTVWGTGTPRRELLHVDDLASACCFLMERYDSPEVINVGTGCDITIDELARTLAGVTGYEGRIEYDTSKPDGTPRKVLDVSRIRALGWETEKQLRAGLEETYQWFMANRNRREFRA